MDRDELASAAGRIQWFHTMELGQGVVTSGFYDPAARLPELALPADLTGMEVLDVGAWDGFYSFEAKRRGARRVLATDSFAWSDEGIGSKAGFELARAALGLPVEDREIDVLELAPETVGRFDVVLMLGVLYHMRHPLLALERVASVTAGRLILDTHVDMVGADRPLAAFYPGSELNGDPTNWWGPNEAAVLAMISAAGFRDARVVWRDSPGYRVGRALTRAHRHERGLAPRLRAAGRGLRQGRIAVHAFR